MKTKCPSLPPVPTQAHMVGSGQPLEHVYFTVEVPNFFSGCPVPYQLDGRYVCLGVQPREALLVTMAN